MAGSSRWWGEGRGVPGPDAATPFLRVRRHPPEPELAARRNSRRGVSLEPPPGPARRGLRRTAGARPPEGPPGLRAARPLVPGVQRGGPPVRPPPGGGVTYRRGVPAVCRGHASGPAPGRADRTVSATDFFGPDMPVLGTRILALDGAAERAAPASARVPAGRWPGPPPGRGGRAGGAHHGLSPSSSGRTGGHRAGHAGPASATAVRRARGRLPEAVPRKARSHPAVPCWAPARG